MKILVTGTSGQLGYDVKKELEKNNHEVISPNRNELDISNQNKVNEYIHLFNPDAVIHCAAWTNVDLAEDEKEKCRAVNVNGTEYIVEACKKLDIPMMFISTDYVFNGTGDSPWKTNDVPSPINVYGQSKLDGENIVKKHKKHFILRISWVFGINGKNFIKTMINLSKTNKTIRVVDDQYGSPTYTVDLSVLIHKIIQSGKYGTYHAHNEGYCSWYELAKKIFELIESNVTVTPISSENYVTKAKRPKNSKMCTKSLEDSGFEKLPEWTDAVERYIHTLKTETGEYNVS